MRIGIVGLPNAGKSSLFNALTNAGAESGNYPFTTVEPNVAVVQVPDERLDRIAATLGASETTHETIVFSDIAGLVRGASEGEGLGNKFLANIRETDAICHVVRCHADDQVIHPEGKVDPVADLETVETELVLADLEQAERRLERVTRQARSLEPELVAERDWLEAVVERLRRGDFASGVPVPGAAPQALLNLQPLTAKPILYVANVGEGEEDVPAEVLAHAEARGARAVAISARIESELAELDAEEAHAMREDLGQPTSGLDRVIKGAWDLLELISFFTGDRDKEARAWSLRRGSTAHDAAGRIHTDIQQGFVRAEVISWSDLVEAGGYGGARERGLVRLEGRDYVVADGDVVTVKHTG